MTFIEIYTNGVGASSWRINPDDVLNRGPGVTRHVGINIEFTSICGFVLIPNVLPRGSFDSDVQIQLRIRFLSALHGRH